MRKREGHSVIRGGDNNTNDVTRDFNHEPEVSQWGWTVVLFQDLKQTPCI